MKLASGSVEQTARVSHIEHHEHLCWDHRHSDLIATVSGDKTVRLWDARNGKCSQQDDLSRENINITYKPDGTHIAVGNRDDELTILDVRNFKPVHKRKFNYESNVQMGRTVHQIPCRGAANSVEWNPRHNLLAYGWG
ncbi:THO complex subunit 3-like isoform X2 [Cucurbita maxima]|uniref:THO complex subunit 3-like isoform X2 n=1 Tax=Cucurbita maxima TaxID=3661 RepID=A0A6J1HJP7_CUCMA|nr:THO complex subunit 3-like isoform X2 [Cucurbita maxima]